MKLWDIIKIVSGILIVKTGCRIIDTAYVYSTDDRTRTAFFLMLLRKTVKRQLILKRLKKTLLSWDFRLKKSGPSRASLFRGITYYYYSKEHPLIHNYI